VCSAADRLLVHETVHDELLDLIVALAEGYDIGPSGSDPDLGPLVSETHFHRVREYIEAGRNEGGNSSPGG
jgi:aldehyde dehydrogenase (NAD+)